MDTSEQLAYTYLQSCGFTDIQYEPDGNVPPDFLCDKRIAVEVRRLNKNYGFDNGSEGLEEVSIPLRQRMEKLLASFGPPTHGDSWFVRYRFARPLPKWKILAPIVKRELDAFMITTDSIRFDSVLNDNFELTLIRSSKPFPQLFVPGGHSDLQSGGFVISDVAKNLKLCIQEKTKKLEKFRDTYPEWWLILPDYVGYGLDEFDRQVFLRDVTIIHNFNKVILLNPLDPKNAFEV